MENQTRSDLKINGTGNTAGGKYNEVTVNGVGEINGDIECESFKTNGASTLNGNLTSKSLKVNGTSVIKGDIKTEEIKVNGSADIKGNIESKNSKVHGEVKITGNLNSDLLELHGGMEVKGNCNAETFNSSGGFTVAGLLNADNINIKLHGPCSAKEIGCEKITVKLGNDYAIKKIIRSIFRSWDMTGKLSADVIEADNIELEQTKAKIVRGNNVIIGEGCEIDLVEYKNNYQKTDHSTVKENKKI